MSKKKDFFSHRLNLATLLITSLFFSQASFANDYIDSAKEYLAKNELNAAVIELKNALKESPKNGLARYLLGKIQLEQGDFASAEQQLSRALKYKHNKDKVSPLLAQAMINQNKLEDAFLFINELYPPSGKTPDDLLALAAVAEIKLSNYSSAVILLDKIEGQTRYTSYAKVLYDFATKKTQQALQQINQLVANYKKDSDLWLLKGHIETTLNDMDSAYDSYNKAYQLSPKAHSYHFFIARTLVQLRRFDEALPILDGFLSINQQNPLVNELKAIVMFSSRNYTDAKLHADRAINNGVSNTRLLAISGVSAFHLNQIESSYQTFTQLIPKIPSNHAINRLYIITQFKLGYIDEAIKNVNNYPIESTLDSDFLSQISVELTKIGRKDLALKFAKKAQPKAQGSTETILNFVKLANNDTSGIDDLLTTASQSPTSLRVKQGLANYYLSKNRLSDAKEIAEQWLKNSPDDLVALAIKGLVSKKEGKVSQAKSYFEKIRKLDPNNLQALVELAQIEFNNDNKALALNLLKEAKTIAPNNHKINDVFLKYHRMAGNFSQAMTILDKQISTQPFNTQLKIQKANALAMDAKQDEAIVLLESLNKKNSRVWKTLSLLYSAKNDSNNVRKSYQEWLKVDKFNPNAYLYNIDFLIKENSLAQGLKIVNQAQKIFTNDSRFMLAKVEVLLKQNKTKAANEAFNSIPENAKNTAQFDRIQGIIHIANRDFQAALQTYKKRFSSAPSSKLAYELATLYRLNKQPEEAINFLDELVSRHPTSKNRHFLRLKQLLAELSAKDNPEKSIELYADIVDLEPNNVVALNNLSWLLFEQNKVSKACTIAQKAHNLAKQSANIADTYGYCLLKNGDMDQALSLLEFAYNGKKQDAKIALNFAEALIEAKQVNKASTVLANIVTSASELIARKNSLEQSLKSLTQ